MKDLRKNTCKTQDKPARQCFRLPYFEAGIISLKSSLLYCLVNFFESNYEEELDSFINFLYAKKSAVKSDCSTVRDLPITWEKIPLQQKQTSSSILYISALPQVIVRHQCLDLNLSNSLQSATQQLAERLNDFQLITVNSQLPCVASTLSFVACLWPEFEIKADRPGWITFQLSDEGLSYWLSHLQMSRTMASETAQKTIKETANKLPEPLFKPLLTPALEKPFKGGEAYSQLNSQSKILGKIAVEEHLWLLQHTFARCNSYLKQVYSHQLDGSGEANQDEPVAIAHIFGPAAARSAQALIQELIRTTDTMFWIPYRCPTKQYIFLLKQASLLCRSFQYFYGDCLPQHSWSTPLPSSCQEAVRRSQLAVVLAVRNTLKTLLESCFQATAPKSL